MADGQALCGTPAGLLSHNDPRLVEFLEAEADSGGSGLAELTAAAVAPAARGG